MKYFLIISLVSVFLGISTSKAVEQVSAPPLPSAVKLSASLKETIQLLDKLLKSNQLPDFYQELFDFSLKSGKKGWEDDSCNEQYVNLRYCFYAAKAPLILFDYDGEIDNSPHIDKGAPWDTADIMVKKSAAIRLVIISYCDSNTLIKNRTELGRLSAEYFASILKCLRADYSPSLKKNLDSTLESIENESNKKFKEKWKSWFNEEGERISAWLNGNPIPTSEEERKKNIAKNELWDDELVEKQRKIQRIYLRMGIMTERNRDLPRIIESMEKDFLIMLLNYFPDRKGEVVKYIRLAGYKDNEINGLIDRTVGRDSKTEFLYKGRSKKDAR